MDDLKKQAEELGLEIDGRWSARRLQDEIDKALGAEQKETKVEKMFPVKLLRNYRPAFDAFVIVEEDGERAPDDIEQSKVRAGTTILLPIAEAQAIINKRIAERNDPIG